jgi:hypothetical protein
MAFALRMIRKPVEDAARYDRVWNEITAAQGRVKLNGDDGPDGGCWRR